MFDIGWEDFRAKMQRLVKDNEEAVLKNWLSEIGYTEPVGYYRSLSDAEFVLYATKVGCLIGKAGVNIRRFETMLSEMYGGEWKVKVFEIRGGFVNV